MRLSSFTPIGPLRLSTALNIGSPEIPSQFGLVVLAIVYRPLAAADFAPLGAGGAIIVVAACGCRGYLCAWIEYQHLY